MAGFALSAGNILKPSELVQSWVFWFMPVGGMAGLLFGFFTSEGTFNERLNDAGNLTTEGGVVGALVGIVLGGALDLMRRSTRSKIIDRPQIRKDSLRVLKGFYNQQLLDVLPVKRADIIKIPFKVRRWVNPIDGFEGQINTAVDLSKAFIQSKPNTEEPAGGRLLITGQPGGGKTVASLRIALMLVDEAERNASTPIPILFNLGSWSSGSHDLKDWMLGDLVKPGGLMEGQTELVGQMLDGQEVSPLLDGLDEIPSVDDRRDCLQSITRYLTSIDRSVSIVVCCRTDEHSELVEEMGPNELVGLNAAIDLQPLPEPWIRNAITALGKNAGGGVKSKTEILSDAMITNPVLVDVFSKPFWLSLSVGLSDDTLASTTSATEDSEVKAELLESFLVNSSLSKDSNERRWLAAIAKLLQDDESPDHSAFYPEDLVGKSVGGNIKLSVTTLLGLFVWVTALPHGMHSAVVLGVADGMFDRNGLVTCFLVSLCFTLMMALVLNIPRPFTAPVLSTYKLPSLREIGRSLIWGGMPFGLYFGLVFGYMPLGQFSKEGAAAGFGFGLISGSIVVIIANGLVTVSQGVRLLGFDRARGASLRTSVRRAISIWIISWLMAGMLSFLAYHGAVDLAVNDPGHPHRHIGAYAPFFWLFLVPYAIALAGLIGGIGQGLNFGGWHLILQWVARRRAVKLNLLPSNLSSFVGQVISKGALRRTGSGVQFCHRELLEYLAREAPKETLADIRRKIS